MYDEIITKAGARQNAYTTDDYTNCHVTFAEEDLETILRIEADRFQNLSYPVEAFKTEARAVIGEYNKNSANPIQKLYEAMRAKAFTTQTYRQTTMGFIEDIEDMPNQYEYSRTVFSRWYRPDNVDPGLIYVFARVKQADDVRYVRDEILRAIATARATPIDARRLEEAKSNARYSFTARLDNIDAIAGTLARYVRYRRSCDTLNNVFRVYESLMPADLDAAANKYFTDESLVVTTLSQEKLPDNIAQLPLLASLLPSTAALDTKQFIVQASELPQLSIKLLFDVGSAYDPKGK